MSAQDAQPYRFELFWEFEHFSYYTLRADGAAQTLADASLTELEEDPTLLPLVERFLQLMRQIGERATNVREPGMLRAEREARALPPEARTWYRLPYLRNLREEGFSLELPALRWYAYDAAQQVLLLFEVGLKTHNDPTQCANVAPLFRFAAQASRYLDENRDDWQVRDLELSLTSEQRPLWL